MEGQYWGALNPSCEIWGLTVLLDLLWCIFRKCHSKKKKKNEVLGIQERAQCE